MLYSINNTNADLATIKLLRLIGSNVKDEEISKNLRSHPDYPSLLSISDVLNNFGANATAHRLNHDEFRQIRRPFIAHSSENGAGYLIIEKMNDDIVQIYTKEAKQKKISISDLKKITDGVVLIPGIDGVANPRTTGGNFSFHKIRTLVLAFLISIIAIGGLSILMMSDINQFVLATLLFKTIGLVTTILLLIQSVDQNNVMVQALCGGKKANCNAILTSAAANVFDGLSWSEVGFFYFSGTWLLSLFAGSETGMLLSLVILNICSLPYTIYSIYYQLRVARQWCIFCCIVQGVLWLEFIPLSTALFHRWHIPSLRLVLVTLICVALPPVIWLITKPVIVMAKKAVFLETQLRSFKYNLASFQALLKKQPKYNSPASDWCITLGNVEAERIITMVTNPYCSPCSNVHALLKDWIERNSNLQLRIVFAASNHEQDPRMPVARHLMMLNNITDKQVVENALNAWYLQDNKNYKEWAKSYPTIFNDNASEQISKQYEWCQMAEIKAIPTILVDGHRLPDNYQLQDIRYLLTE